MAHQINIKPVIELLCSFCKKLGFSKITPELFRQAKFNFSEACKPFWILLYEVLYFATYKKITDFEKTTIEDIIAFVRAVFHDLGYKSKEFFYSSPLNGSRMLLIAFGWLVGRYQIIDLLVDNAESCYLNVILGNCGEEVAKHGRDRMLNLSDALDYLLVRHNRSCMEWKSLRQLFQFIAKRVVNTDYQLQEVDPSIQPFFSNATMLDVIAVMDSKRSQEQIITALEKEHRLLSVYLKWIKNEEIFWKWMASVVDNDEKEGTEKEYLNELLDGDLSINSITEKQKANGLDDIVCSKISELSELVSKLTQALLMVNWTKIDCKSHRFSCSTLARPSSGGNEIETLIENIQYFISEIEHKLKLLDEKVKNSLTLENDDSMEDIIHLPLPRK